MGKAKQLEKNIKLSEKLSEYLASNPAAAKKVPKGASFVVFSFKDKELNRLNKELVKSLKHEGKKVVEAKEQDSKKEPWSFELAV
ncbi:MAG: DUF5647 family protein [Patescibacteria group bacterium]